MVPHRLGRKLRLSREFLSDPHRSIMEAEVGECVAVQAMHFVGVGGCEGGCGVDVRVDVCRIVMST